MARRFPGFALAAIVLIHTTAALGDEPRGRVFMPADMLRSWESHSFAGESRYTLERREGRPAVHARCAPGEASGLFFRGEIDLRRTPVIEWSWLARVNEGGPPETEKAGDDFAARIYVVDEHSLLRWRTRALNYVWSRSQPAGADWTNPFASQAHMIAVESGSAQSGWVTERRNMLDDFRRYHDRAPETVSALAIMTDCDNAGRAQQAWYGPIRLLPR